MIIFAWNCRDLGQASAIRDLRALLHSSKPDCLILMETKVNDVTMIRILRNLDYSNHVYQPPVGLSGGLCVAWKDSMDMEPITLSKNIISLLVSSTPGSPWRLYAIYGPCNYSSKRAFWNSLSMNSRIDRGVANEEWWSLFPNANLQLLPQTTSDHHPQLLSCFGHNMFAKRPFRFEAAWVEDCRTYWVVNHAWALRNHPRPPTSLLNKLQYTRKALSRWNKDQFGNIQANIKATREALTLAQQNLDSPSNLDYDRNLRCHLDHLLKMEEML
ncbi:hypothetical protein UlMin_034489 [Ulmus minor]